MTKMNELNQKSMQTPAEEENRRNKQVKEIDIRVRDLERKMDDKTKLLEIITSEHKEEKLQAEKKLTDLNMQHSQCDSDNKLEQSNLLKKFTEEKDRINQDHTNTLNEKIKSKTAQTKIVEKTKSTKIGKEKTHITEYYNQLGSNKNNIKN